MSFTETELVIFEHTERLRRAGELFSASLPETDLCRFILDFDKLACAVTALPSRNGNRNFLPFGPLRRMTLFFGVERLRFLFRLGYDNTSQRLEVREKYQSWEHFRLVLRRRLDSEYPDNGKRKNRSRNHVNLVRFGNMVLECESEGLSRMEALKKAGRELGASRDDRTLQRWFKQFTEISRTTGFVPRDDFTSGKRIKYPRFPLLRAGRAKPGVRRN